MASEPQPGGSVVWSIILYIKKVVGSIPGWSMQGRQQINVSLSH